MSQIPTLKGSLYLFPNFSTLVELPLVNRYRLEHGSHLLCLIVDLLERADGFLERSVGKEYFGNPKRNLFLFVLELDVLLQIFKTVFNKDITAPFLFLHQGLLRLGL